MPVTAPGRALRFARALTPAGAPAEGGGLRRPVHPARVLARRPTRLLPPVTPRQIFQVALNYADHAAEMTLPLPQQPFVFAGLPSAMCGPYDDIVLPPAGQHDWEVELAVVIRRRARQVDRAGTADCIAGYTIANDLTTRDRLRQAGPGRSDYLAAKNPPTFLPTGPFLVPGDLLLTGTPAGTGSARGRFLQPGDVIEAAIGELGQQRNRCVAGPEPCPGKRGTETGGRRAA